MARTSSADETYARAEEQLAAGRPSRAAHLLHETLDRAPRSAQSVYLLGVCLLAQGEIAAARAVLDHAFAIKPWLRDVTADVLDTSALAEAALADDPSWTWARYEVERRAFLAVGLTLDNVVASGLTKASTTFVQIGANDGRSGDPINEHVTRYGWSGLCVEPLPEPYSRLVATYQDHPGVRTANVAVTGVSGPLDIHVREGAASTLASLRPERNALSRGGATTTIAIQGVTFRELLESHQISSYDLLQIDTEGYDFEVLKLAELHRTRPAVVHMEFYCLDLADRLACFALLREQRYAYRFLGRDLLAVDRERFAAPFAIVDRTGGRFLTDRDPRAPAVRGRGGGLLRRG